MACNKLSDGFLDKGKSILCKERALGWKADDRIEDGYEHNLIPKKTSPHWRKGYESEYPSASKPSSSRLPPQSPFKGETLRKTKGSINGNPFYKQLNQKVISASKTTAELSDGKIIRKSENLTLEVISFFHHFLTFILKYAQGRRPYQNFCRQEKQARRQVS